jgi:serine/threonine-protein kinase RsbW
MLVAIKKETHHLQLASTPESIVVLDNWINQLATSLLINETLHANISTALNEALTNAIHHGNKLSADKTVNIWVKITENNTLSFTVSDEGNGFNYRTLPQPISPENIEKLTGRGVFIMQQLAHQCTFNAQGNSVELHFLLA